MSHRKLTTAEIQLLEKQFCHCNDWSLIEVAENFITDNIQSVTFSGKNKLGVFSKDIPFRGGITKKAGIHNATIHQCEIGNEVYINHVTNYIANYKIEDNVIIDNIDLMETYPDAIFGNGTEVAVLDETGSRKVKIFEQLNSATAYLLCTYRHNEAAVKILEQLIDRKTQEKTSDFGSIGEATVIRNCTSIIDTNIGSSAEIHGVSLLKNGTVCSSALAPTLVGHNVIAKDFIIASGASVLDGSLVETSFVGESCLIGKGFSAMNCLFFANCEMLHGEAVSVFAGPFTVSHHKSTLLIGGMFSFFNAGSGTNMSNHMYKLGPMHYGVMQRGCKMSSDSYLMWPGKIGAFSVVLGKIKKHIDTSALPYSYILSNNSDYSLMPAMNITSIGTYRDSNKWINRDKRKQPEKLDSICLESLNPFVIQQLQKAITKLREFKEKNPQAEAYLLSGCKIKALFVTKAIELYQMMIDIYLGNVLLKNKTAKETAISHWLDLAGTVLPAESIDSLFENLEKRTINSIDDWNNLLKTYFIEYESFEAFWAASLTNESKENQIKRSIEANEKYSKIIISDAQKEFSGDALICFGLDQGENEKLQEQKNIRGELSDHLIIKEIIQKTEKTIESLKAIKTV